jgi:hypothetical protein
MKIEMSQKPNIIVAVFMITFPLSAWASSLSPQEGEERWMIPPTVEQTNSGPVNTNIVKGIAVIPSPSPSPSPSPRKEEREQGRLSLSAYPVPHSPAELNSAIIQQSSAPVDKNEDAALPGDKRSLVAFYSVKGGGERTLLRFSSSLSLPDGKTVRNSVSIFTPADGVPRIVPLFYGMEVSASSLPGEYSMDWVAEEVSSGRPVTASAKFLRASATGSAKTIAPDGNWQGVSGKESALKFNPKPKIPMPKDNSSAFDTKGVGVQKTEEVDYKFETKPAPPQGIKKPAGKSFPAPSPSPRTPRKRDFRD